MYLIKLKIELNMADLIVRIVRASNPAPGHALHRYTEAAPRPQHHRASLHVALSRAASEASTSNTKAQTAGTSQTNVVHDDGGPPRGPLHAAQHGDVEQGWELTRMPSNFDAGDVVDVRKFSVAEGCCAGMVPLAAVLRPQLVRTMSELTQLEVSAGYLDQEVRDKRTSEIPQT